MHDLGVGRAIDESGTSFVLVVIAHLNMRGSTHLIVHQPRTHGVLPSHECCAGRSAKMLGVETRQLDALCFRNESGVR